MIKKSILTTILIMAMFNIAILTSAIQESNIKSNYGSYDDYTHTVLVEFGTSETCTHCPPVSEYLKDIYQSNHDIYIVTLNADEKPAKNRVYSELPNNPMRGLPCVWIDGGFKTIAGDKGSSNPYKNNIDDCGKREVADIDLKLSLTWDDKKIGINLEVTNNEKSTYNGHLHAYITEIESRWEYYTNGYPFHYAMLDYAINKDITISEKNKKQYTVEWDAKNSQYPDIEQENIMIIATVFSQQSDYTDETIALKVSESGRNKPPEKPNNPTPKNGEQNIESHITLEWTCIDPDNDLLTYDIYLGTTINPPKIKTNHTTNNYKPETPLTPGTTYHWKIKAKDNQQKTKIGKIWSFTVSGIPPLEAEKPIKIDIKKGISIGKFSLRFGKINIVFDNNCDNIADFNVSINTKIGINKINKEKNGTINPGQNEEIIIKDLRDIGIIEIEASAYVKEIDKYVNEKMAGIIIGHLIILL